MKEALLHDLKQLQEDFLSSLSKVEDENELQGVKSSFLGKKGRLTAILKGMGGLSQEDRPIVGEAANKIKTHLETQYQSKLSSLKSSKLADSLSRDHFDITLPGRPEYVGHIHPVSQVLQLSQDIFSRLGFDICYGPEIEDDYHNFEALNIPADHPARDLQDTFYLKGSSHLLRTHTSTVQIHVMEKQQPPVRMIAPGAVYRCDSDITHTPMFHQIEGLWIDEKTTFADLKGVLTLFVREIFGSKIKVRFRPSFFPFTEPSAELDISCPFCQGTTCRICGQTGWIEVLGCGMVDPNVFAFVRYDPERYTGFAFGIGIERIAMLKMGISDLRLFFENDVRFLEQF